MKWFRRIFLKSDKKVHSCKKVIRKLGFKKNSAYDTYHKDFGTFDCEIWIRNNRIKLLVFAKDSDYYESETLGPPLPNKEELISFIKNNT